MVSDPILEAFQRRCRAAAPVVVARRRRASAADVDALARALAAELMRRGAGPGTLVALQAPNGPAFLAGLLAIRRVAAAALLLDASLPGVEKRRAARGLGATTLLACRRVWPRGAGDFTLTPLDAAPRLRDRLAEALAPDVAVVKLTSGSTGGPRGILTPSAALLADERALKETMDLDDDEKILAAIPMSHSYGLSSVALPALVRPTTLMLPAAGRPLDPMIAARLFGVTFLPTVPAFLHALVRRARPPAASAALRRVVSAGAPLDPRAAARFRERYGQPVHVFYGASECGGITFDRDGSAGERGGLGTPVAGVDVRLAGGGERGAVVVRSPAVARGYFPDPDPDLGDGVFRTRDLGSFRDGELYLEGRLDEMINVRGRKVNPREVEAILGRLRGVDDAVVLGVAPPGGGERVVRAFVACRPGRLSGDAVRAWCRRHLAEHKVPRGVVLLERIPRTERGKVDRAALRRLEPFERRARGARRSEASHG